jgi:isochorismate hydrolase
VFYKHVNSSFVGTDLEQRLRDAGIDSVVIAGLATDHCVCGEFATVTLTAQVVSALG